MERSGQGRPGDEKVRAGQTWVGEVTADQIRGGKVRTGQTWVGEVTAGQTLVGEVIAGQTRG